MVLAHPDDESFGMGGTLAYYANKGVEVHLICATKGEAGEVDPEHLVGFSNIGELRESELRCAAKTLNLTEVYFLDYRDSGMPGMEANNHLNAFINVPLDIVSGKIVEYIRKIKPQILITFDPNGGYFHPDHIHIHNATVQAFNESNDVIKYPDGLEPFKAEKLYYRVFPRKLLKFVVAVIKLFRKEVAKFGKNKDIDLEYLAGSETYPPHITIDVRPQSSNATKAAECHASQFDFSRQGNFFVKWYFSSSSRKETFMLSYPEPRNNFRARDLFF